MTKKSDEPPVPVFLAGVVQASKELDLAVLQIRSDLSGKDLDPSTLGLPNVPLGDSDELELGDTLNIFGYPGIGGKNITYTAGPVSGFDTDPNFKGRAWIKTSASISGGNSGGTAVTDDGLLVGIPTQGGSASANAAVDCRAVADTNRDGKLDDKDTCVPAGGFINSLRSVNAAKSLIEAAQDGNDSGGGGGRRGLPAGGGGGGGGGTTTTTRPRRATTTTAPPDTEPVDTEPLDTLPPETEPPTTRRRSTPTTRPAARNDVGVEGFLIDAATGRPIAGAFFYVLMPGVKWKEVTNETYDQTVFASLKTDSNGYFTHPQLRLPRGQAFGMGALAKGYAPVLADDVAVPSDAPDPIRITIKLDRE